MRQKFAIVNWRGRKDKQFPPTYQAQQKAIPEDIHTADRWPDLPAWHRGQRKESQSSVQAGTAGAMPAEACCLIRGPSRKYRGTRLARRRDGMVADAHDHPDVRGHLPRRSRPEPPDALRWASGWLHRGHASGDCSPSDATALRAALFTCCDYCASFASFFDTAHARPGMRRGAPELAAASALGGRNAGSGTGWTKDMVMSRSVPPKPLTGGARPLGRRPYYRQRLPSGTSPS